MTAEDADPLSRKVLFFTHAESGQANTILALALELLTRPHVQVHVASFPILSRRVHALNQAIEFHTLDGTDMLGTLPAQGLAEESISHPPVSKSWDLHDRLLIPALAVWSGEGSSHHASFIISGNQRVPIRVYAYIRELQEGGPRNPTRPGHFGCHLQSRA